MIILLFILAWNNVPVNCDPVDYWNQPQNVQEALVEMGYFTWVGNCLNQQRLQRFRLDAND